ncbi:ABC transporter substrate-binding protein [Tessaracoccus coleopterorum]|uniref:ABC transporter substrate-binding protein n=1 Tax=Tessaracoccus coleopterorum TaxID=2714950 RepID=UPI0018D2DC55|nr:extracellular solute-binding protein [Tessaracoccus coleopterorum]
MKRSGASIVAGLTVAALALTACGSTEPEATGSPTGAPSESATAPAEPVNLTFQSLSDQPAAIEVTKQIVDTWNADNPSIQVEIVPAGWDGIYDKLITQFNGGAAPDVIHYEAASIVPFARDGYLADLTEHMSADHKADIPEGILKTVTVDDQIVGYPTELQSYMVFANTKLLTAAGIEIPTGDTMTWDQLREMAKKATANGVTGLGWGLASPTAAMMAMSPGFGGTWFDGTGSDATITVGDAELALPTLVHEMTYTDKSLLPVTLTLSGGKTLPYFYDGQIAMTIQGPSRPPTSPTTRRPTWSGRSCLPSRAGGRRPGRQPADPLGQRGLGAHRRVGQVHRVLHLHRQPRRDQQGRRADPATTSAQEALAAEMAGETGWDNILKSGKHMTSARTCSSTPTLSGRTRWPPRVPEVPGERDRRRGARR